MNHVNKGCCSSLSNSSIIKVAGGLSVATGFLPQVAGVLVQFTNISSGFNATSVVAVASDLYISGGTFQGVGLVLFGGACMYDLYSYCTKTPESSSLLNSKGKYNEVFTGHSHGNRPCHGHGHREEITSEHEATDNTSYALKQSMPRGADAPNSQRSASTQSIIDLDQQSGGQQRLETSPHNKQLVNKDKNKSDSDDDSDVSSTANSNSGEEEISRISLDGSHETKKMVENKIVEDTSTIPTAGDHSLVSTLSFEVLPELNPVIYQMALNHANNSGNVAREVTSTNINVEIQDGSYTNVANEKEGQDLDASDHQ